MRMSIGVLAQMVGVFFVGIQNLFESNKSIKEPDKLKDYNNVYYNKSSSNK